MIQRIQTVYLLLAAVAALLLLFLPIGALSLETSAELDLIKATEVIALMALVLVMVSLPLLAIFLYAKRGLQIQVGGVGLLTALAFIAVFLAGFASEFDAFQPMAGAAMPVLYVVFVLLAIRGIRADEKLVKSMDRFR
jgi:hypothetical protein